MKRKKKKIPKSILVSIGDLEGKEFELALDKYENGEAGSGREASRISLLTRFRCLTQKQIAEIVSKLSSKGKKIAKKLLAGKLPKLEEWN